MPVAIIDDLEIININKKNGSRLVRMLFDVVHDALQSPQEQNAVWKTSEHVMAGVEKKFFLSVFSLGYVACIIDNAADVLVLNQISNDTFKVNPVSICMSQPRLND